MKKDYYDILNIPQNASREEIKRAYYILAQQFHPDRNNGNESRFKEINEAYRILSIIDSRAEYDKSFSKSSHESTPTSSSASNIVNKEFNLTLVYRIIFVGLIIIAFVLFGNNEAQQSTSQIPTDHVVDVPQNTSTNEREKCTSEGGVKICDLSYSSSPYTKDFRDITVEGNTVACIDTETSEVSQNDVGKLRASTNKSFCATDWGHMYIDPTLKVEKHYDTITRGDYNKPFKVSGQYDTCIWAYNDGNGVIPYLEVLSSTGPRSGYDMRAFCLDDQSKVHIFTEAK